jgi:tetratricopeptide (TPR) repeat protein
LRAALDGHRRTSNLNGELAALEELSLLHTQRGPSAAAVSAADQGYNLAVIARDRRAQAALLIARGEAHLRADAGAAAHETFGRALEIAGEYPFLETRATIGTANVLLARGDVADARKHAERALAEAAGADTSSSRPTRWRRRRPGVSQAKTGRRLHGSPLRPSRCTGLQERHLWSPGSRRNVRA